MDRQGLPWTCLIMEGLGALGRQIQGTAGCDFPHFQQRGLMGDRGLGRVHEVLGTCRVGRGPGESPGGQEHLGDSQKKWVQKGDRGMFRGVGGKLGDLMAQNSKEECWKQKEGGSVTPDATERYN